MLEFTVTHKHCGMVKTIEGENVYDAFKKNGLSFEIWIVKSVKQIKA